MTNTPNTRYVLVAACGSWGRGTTIEEAYKAANKAYRTYKKTPCTVRVYEVADLDHQPYVDEAGYFTFSPNDIIMNSFSGTVSEALKYFAA